MFGLSRRCLRSTWRLRNKSSGDQAQTPPPPDQPSILCTTTLHLHLHLSRFWVYFVLTWPFCEWIGFFGLPIKSYSGLRPLVYKKYTLKEPDSRLRPIELLGCKNTKNKNLK
jgi:hypothetical protein